MQQCAQQATRTPNNTTHLAVGCKKLRNQPSSILAPYAQGLGAEGPQEVNLTVRQINTVVRCV